MFLNICSYDFGGFLSFRVQDKAFSKPFLYLDS